MTADDPIRAWLDVMINEGAMDVDYYGAGSMCDALRAVLSLCDLVEADGGEFVSIEVVRADIATAIGVETT